MLLDALLELLAEAVTETVEMVEGGAKLWKEAFVRYPPHCTLPHEVCRPTGPHLPHPPIRPARRTAPLPPQGLRAGTGVERGGTQPELQGGHPGLIDFLY